MAQQPTTGIRTIDGKPFRRDAGAVTAEYVDGSSMP
jgi:hypothetical protein